MKILFLTYDLPYPLISGGKVRAYHLLKNLSKKHQITLFSFYRTEEQRKYLSHLKKYCSRIILFKRRGVWSWQNFLISFLTFLPFPAATYWLSELKGALKRELVKNDYDLVHFESFYPALYLPLVKKIGLKTVFGNENIEYQIYQRYAQSRCFFLWRWFLNLEVWRMRFFEEGLWRRADLNLALSPQDATLIKKKTKRPCPVIANGVDVQSFQNLKRKSDGQTLIFIGTLNYQPNNDAMKYFLSKVYPLIKAEISQIKFKLVSWYQPEWLKKYLQDSSIDFIQDKQTLAKEFYRKADILVAPIRIASGTNIKVLEAMAAGLAIVTTSIGIEGIKAKNGQQVIVADQAHNFAKQTINLLKQPQKRQELAKNGRKLVAQFYDWPKIVQKLDKVYQEFVKKEKNEEKN